MSTERAALLIIDMISAFDFPEARRMQQSVRSSACRIQVLRKAFHELGLPVIYANDNFADWRADFSGLIRIAATSGPLGRYVTERLSPTHDDYFILKPKHSAFLATALPILLAKLGVTSLYLTGMTADSCVLATALDANAREYRVHVVADAVAGLAGLRSRALDIMRDGCAAKVVTARAIEARLRRG